MSNITPHGLSAQELSNVLAQDLSAFVENGRVLRVVSENDDDCRRDTVEEFTGGRWGAIVIASLDWRKELNQVLTAHKLAA